MTPERLLKELDFLTVRLSVLIEELSYYLNRTITINDLKDLKGLKNEILKTRKDGIK